MCVYIYSYIPHILKDKYKCPDFEIHYNVCALPSLILYMLLVLDEGLSSE